MLSKIQVVQSNGVSLTAYDIGSGVTISSDSINTNRGNEYQGLLLRATGTMTVTRQVSVDGSNWYTPYSLTGASLSAVDFNSTSITKYIILTAVSSNTVDIVSPYQRFVFLAHSNCTITEAVYVAQEV